MIICRVCIVLRVIVRCVGLPELRHAQHLRLHNSSTHFWLNDDLFKKGSRLAKKRLVHRMCYDGVSARMNLVFSSLLAFHSFACVSILWTAERIEVNNEVNFYSIIHWREIKFWIIFSVESFFFVIVALATVGCLYVFVFVVLWIKTMERTESQCHLDI